MNIARDRTTGEIVDAQDLKAIGELVDQGNYECPACGTPLLPCSFMKYHVRIPHFREGQPHADDCDIDGKNKPRKRAKGNRKANAENGTPERYPNRLVLKDKRTVAPQHGDIAGGSKGTRAQHLSEEVLSKARQERHWAARTIRPICKTFLTFPRDRKSMTLEITGIDTNRYVYAFKKINQYTTHYDKKRIFYAKVSWTSPRFHDYTIDIPLGVGHWQNGKLVLPFRIKVDCSNWGQRTKNYIVNEINDVRESVIAAKKQQNNNKNKEGLIFFIGQQDDADPMLFHVNDHRLICCLFEELFYPESSNKTSV